MMPEFREGEGWKMVWTGDEVVVAARRALGRGIIAIGENVSVRGKEHAHVISGTMRRSIHVALPSDDHSGDEDAAAGGLDLGETIRPQRPDQQAGGMKQVIEVGSWVPYACVEEVGRNHQFMTPAVQEVQGARSAAIMYQAFREEGLL